MTKSLSKVKVIRSNPGYLLESFFTSLGIYNFGLSEQGSANSKKMDLHPNL